MAENTNPPPTEEIDKETLISLLKDKGKEIKSLESKNKKLEERYVKIFRENKNLSKDKETLEKLLLIVFDRDQERFTNVESGTYDLTALTDLWNQRQDEKIRLFNETLEGHKFEKSELDKRVAELEKELEKAQNESSPEADKVAEKYKTRISELENANHKLSNEIKELNDVLEDKNQEITRLRNIENEIDSIKAELLMKELQIKNIHEESSIKGKMLESERKNEVLRLRQEVESYQAKIKEYEAEKAARINNVRTQSVQTELLQVSNFYVNSEPLDASPHKSAHHSSPPGSIRRIDSEGYGSQFNENGQVNQEYLKNVIVKLFCYIEGDNLKEARVLMNAISIIMKMNQEDKDQIEEARRNNSLWSNTVHFLKDTFTHKGEVNYYSGSEGQK